LRRLAVEPIGDNFRRGDAQPDGHLSNRYQVAGNGAQGLLIAAGRGQFHAQHIDKRLVDAAPAGIA